MSEQDATEPQVFRDHFGSIGVRSGAFSRKSTGASIIGPRADAEREGKSETGPGFLSESDAARHLGISIAQLAGLRKFDLAMIEKGFKPHGPPPLWRGGVCIYASETLDEWAQSQTPKDLMNRLSVRQQAA